MGPMDGGIERESKQKDKEERRYKRRSINRVLCGFSYALTQHIHIHSKEAVGVEGKGGQCGTDVRTQGLGRIR